MDLDLFAIKLELAEELVERSLFILGFGVVGYGMQA
jgi:hypothetical protein